MVELSVVLPAHNEQATIEQVVYEVHDVLDQSGVASEIIVVNDGSVDRTGQILHALAKTISMVRLIEHHPGRGYGGALRAGFDEALGKWIAFFPTDGQFVFSEVSQLAELTDRADIISGYRIDRQDPAIRRMNAFGWNLAVRTLFGYLCRDIDCGFKLFRREILDHVQLVSDGAMIDTELLAGAKAYGYVIAELPVTHLSRQAGEATGAAPQVILTAFRDLVRFRIRLSREARRMEAVSGRDAGHPLRFGRDLS